MTEFIYALLPEHLLLLGLFALLGLEMGKANVRSAAWVVNGALIGGCLVLLQQNARDYTAHLAEGELYIDSLALHAKLVLLGAALLLNVTMRRDTSIKSRFLICSSLLGALVMMESAGFISLFIGLEMLSLPAFALMVHRAGETAAAEGAFKYLLLSSVATALVLFGVAFAYGASGDLSIASFMTLLSVNSPEAIAASILIASGLFMKAAVFPFHGWAPDAYAAARLPVTSFLASVVKGAVVLTLLRVFMTSAVHDGVVLAVGALAVLSIAFGNIAALKQQRFKRLLAYSSIAHAGYMMTALLDTTGARVHDLLWYVAIYALTIIIACASFSALRGEDHDEVQALDGAFYVRPGAALLFGLSMLSLAGLPPLPGFFAKVFIFSSAIASGHLLVAILAFIGSFIGVTYYLRLFFRLFAADATSLQTAPEKA